MKSCMICGALGADLTCPHCGEASWMMDEAPKAVSAPVVAPVAAPVVSGDVAPADPEPAPVAAPAPISGRRGRR